MKTSAKATTERIRAITDCAIVLGVDMPDKARIEAYLRLLADVPTQALLAAIDKHLNDPQRGRFFPTVADIRAQLETVRGKPMTADEAWAIALNSFDERASIVWNDVIEQARNAALAVWDEGDKVGARMAFKSAYDRLAALYPQPRWKLSVGLDPEQRKEAVLEAQMAGFISHEQAVMLLPAPPPDPEMASVAGLLVGKTETPPGPASERIAEARHGARKALEDYEQRVAREKQHRHEAHEKRRAELLRQVEELERRSESAP